MQQVSHSESHQPKGTGLRNSKRDDDLLLLVEGCRRGERLAQEQLYKKMFSTMMGICMRYTGQREDALDALNQSFLKVFQKIHEYKGEGSFEGWVKRIVFTTVMDLLRTRVRFQEKHQLDEPQNYPVGPSIDDRLNMQDLMKLIQSLPDTTRLIFNLFAIEGYKHQEIAQELNIQEGTSKWHVSEARRILKQKIHKLTYHG